MLATWQVGQVFWSFLWFSLFFLWIWTAITVFGDIFRSPDLGGWAKAAWTVFIIVAPFLGMLVYLIARGPSMEARIIAAARAQEEVARTYIHEVAGSSGGAAAQIAQAVELRDRGAITDAEFITSRRVVDDGAGGTITHGGGGVRPATQRTLQRWR